MNERIEEYEEYPNNPYELLAHAIILTAVEDYRYALKKIRKRPDHQYAKDLLRECEGFFKSDWYRILTDLDGDTLIRMLREESEKCLISKSK